MAQLAQVDTVAAPACPNCRQRITDLPLDELADGAEYQCLFCGHTMRIPEAVLTKLIAQRDAARARAAANNPSFLARLASLFSRLFRG